MAHRRQEFILDVVQLVQPQVDASQFIDLAVEVAVHAAQLFLHGHQMPQHSIEGVTELLEFVAGADIGAHVELAVCDRVADFLQVQHRLRHDVSNHQIDGDDRQHDLHQLGRDHEGIHEVQRRLHTFERQGDLDRTEEFSCLTFNHLSIGVGASLMVMARKARLGRFERHEVLILRLFAVDFLIDVVHSARSQFVQRIPIASGGLELEVHVLITGMRMQQSALECLQLFRLNFEVRVDPVGRLAGAVQKPFLFVLQTRAQDRAAKLRSVLHRLNVSFQQEAGRQRFSRRLRRPVEQPRCLSAVQEKRRDREQRQPRPEQHHHLQLEVGFTQQTFQRAIRH